MMATVCKRGTIAREQLQPPTTAVAVGGAMPKGNGTGTSSQSGGDGDGTTERLVGSPPSPLLADIFGRRRDAAWKRCLLAAMSITTATTMG